MSYITTTNKIWDYHATPETKRASKEWSKKGKSWPVAWHGSQEARSGNSFFRPARFVGHKLCALTSENKRRILLQDFEWLIWKSYNSSPKKTLAPIKQPWLNLNWSEPAQPLSTLPIAYIYMIPLRLSCLWSAQRCSGRRLKVCFTRPGYQSCLFAGKTVFWKKENMYKICNCFNVKKK